MFNATGSTNEAFFAALSTITTLAGYICPSMYTAQAAQKGAFVYRWNHTLSCPFSRPKSLDYGPFPTPQLRDQFGPTHISDIPFVFGNLDHMPLGNGTCNATKAEYALSDQMRASWTAMATKQNPSVDGLTWPKFSSCDDKGVNYNDVASVGTVDYGECAFWGAIWNDMAGAKLDWLGKSECSNSTSGSSPSGTAGSSPSKPVSASSRVSVGVYGVAVAMALVLLA